MGCKHVKVGDVTAVVCVRGRPRQAKPCSEPHCGRPHEFLCDYPVTRQGKSTTCSRRLCPDHAVKVPAGDYCPAHARFADRTQP